MKQKSKKRAWLVTWEWNSGRDRREPKVVAILDARLGRDRMRCMLQAFFIQGEPLTLDEKIYHGQPWKRLPELFCPSDCGIRVAGTPELYARIVDDLRVVKNTDESQALHWTEPEVWKLTDGRNRELICRAHRCSWPSEPIE